MLLALIANLDIELEEIDVKIAFLHEELNEEIFIAQLEGFKVLRSDDPICL